MSLTISGFIGTDKIKSVKKIDDKFVEVEFEQKEGFEQLPKQVFNLKIYNEVRSDKAETDMLALRVKMCSPVAEAILETLLE